MRFFQPFDTRSNFFETLRDIFEHMPTSCPEISQGHWLQLVTFLDKCPICGAGFDYVNDFDEPVLVHKGRTGFH